MRPSSGAKHPSLGAPTSTRCPSWSRSSACRPDGSAGSVSPSGSTPSSRKLVDFACQTITPGSTIHTDGAYTLRRLAELGYTHTFTTSYDAAEPEAVLPGVHLVASLLKRWINGTLQHNVSREHLGYYLDEYAFRFNRRNSRARGMLFYRLLQQAARTDPHPLTELYSSR